MRDRTVIVTAGDVETSVRIRTWSEAQRVWLTSAEYTIGPGSTQTFVLVENQKMAVY